MHIFFSGIGGTAIGPLALIAKQAGYEVSGSDEKDSQYIQYLNGHGIADIHLGQSREQIEMRHIQKPIDWFVYSSALPKDHPEITFSLENKIKVSKRDELLNKIIGDNNLSLIAIAGTHGKTTTTAMVVWLLKQLGIAVSYSVGAKIPFGDMGHYEPGSKYFVYECDEFDRNFLAFHPFFSLISGIGWDHHEVFPTEEEYRQAFRDFIAQSDKTVLWREDHGKLQLTESPNHLVLDGNSSKISTIRLPGLYNRRDAWLAANAVQEITKEPLDKLTGLADGFPGISRRMEKIVDNLYTDYAHTPEKILGAMSVAAETAKSGGQKVVVVYEPLTNRRMHHTKDLHRSIFKGASKLYWVPSYLAREDPDLPVLHPTELIGYLDDETKDLAEPMALDTALKHRLDEHLTKGDLVLCLSGGGGGSLDEWLRKQYQN